MIVGVVDVCFAEQSDEALLDQEVLALLLVAELDSLLLKRPQLPLKHLDVRANELRLRFHVGEEHLHILSALLLAEPGSDLLPLQTDLRRLQGVQRRLAHYEFLWSLLLFERLRDGDFTQFTEETTAA